MFIYSFPNAAPKQAINEITHFESLLPSYDIFFIDVVGVVHDGITGIDEAISTINILCQQKNKKVFFLSNTPRPGIKTYNKLIELGIQEGVHVFTSGDATRTLLMSKYKDKTLYHLGSDRNDEILQGLSIKETKKIEECDFVLLTAFLESDESISKYQQDLDYIIAHKPEVICANPDLHASYGNTIRKCAGYISQFLEQSGVHVVYIGKPNSLIFDILFEAYNISPDSKARSIMIGDTLETDIKGANAFGISSYLVLTGNAKRSISLEEKTMEEYLLQCTHMPTYFGNHLSW